MWTHIQTERINNLVWSVTVVFNYLYLYIRCWRGRTTCATGLGCFDNMGHAAVYWKYFDMKNGLGEGGIEANWDIFTQRILHILSQRKHSDKLHSIWQDPATQHTRLHHLLPCLSNTIVQTPTEHNRAQKEEKQWLKGRVSSWTSASFIIINRRHNFSWTPREEEEEEVEFNLPSYEKLRAEHSHLTSLTS